MLFRSCGFLQRLARCDDISLSRARQPRDHGFTNLFGHLSDRFEVAGRGGGKTDLDDINVETLQLTGDLYFFSRVQVDARRLLSVA